ncbi:MAG: glycoside hydrolase family 6 protein [Marmoricola sp.]
MNGPRLRQRRTARLIGVLAAAILAGSVSAPAAHAEQAPLPVGRAAVSSNPLDDGPWPYYTAPWNPIFAAWSKATGTQKALLAKIATRPRVIWFASSVPTDQAAELIRTRIDDTQHGDENAWAQIAIFRLHPKGEARRLEPVTAQDQADYKAWIDQVAAGIGSSKVLMVLEPDLAVSWKGSPAIRFALAAYAARVFGALPNTRIYLDASDNGWLKPAKAVSMLLQSGVGYVDGIALGATHYTSTAGNVLFGANLVRRLAARGYPGRKVVIDTADNGRPFTYKQFIKAHPHGVLSDANLCRTRAELRCVTLGIPPTTDVANPRWGMSSGVRAAARQYVDAYLWFGRPWDYKQSSPFLLNRALAIAATTRY